MSYRRLEELGGIQWPCYSEDRLEPSFLHGRLWDEDPEKRGRLAPFSVVAHELPVEALTEEFPLRLTTGRRLDSYNTGVQSGGYASPLRRGETVDLSPADAAPSARQTGPWSGSRPGGVRWSRRPASIPGCRPASCS